MKKILKFLLCTVLAVSLILSASACGNDEEKEEPRSAVSSKKPEEKKIAINEKLIGNNYKTAGGDSEAGDEEPEFETDEEIVKNTAEAFLEEVKNFNYYGAEELLADGEAMPHIIDVGSSEYSVKNTDELKFYIKNEVLNENGMSEVVLDALIDNYAENTGYEVEETEDNGDGTYTVTFSFEYIKDFSFEDYLDEDIIKKAYDEFAAEGQEPNADEITKKVIGSIFAECERGKKSCYITVCRDEVSGEWKIDSEGSEEFFRCLAVGVSNYTRFENENFR